MHFCYNRNPHKFIYFLVYFKSFRDEDITKNWIWTKWFFFAFFASLYIFSVFFFMLKLVPCEMIPNRKRFPLTIIQFLSPHTFEKLAADNFFVKIFLKNLSLFVNHAFFVSFDLFELKTSNGLWFWVLIIIFPSHIWCIQLC